MTTRTRQPKKTFRRIAVTASFGVLAMLAGLGTSRAESDPAHAIDESKRSVSEEQAQGGAGSATATTLSAEPSVRFKTLHPFQAAFGKKHEAAGRPNGRASMMTDSFRDNASTNGVALQGNVSYQINNNVVTFKVDQVINSRPGGTTGSLRLSLWATKSGYGGGTISGYVLATYQFPSQLQPGQYYYNITENTNLNPPPAGVYYVTLTLEEYTGSGWAIDDFVTFSGTANFGGGAGGGAPELQGNTSWQIQNGLLTMKVDRVVNNGSGTTGSLRLEVWATQAPYGGGSISGYVLGSYQFTSQLGPGQYFYNIAPQVPVQMPPPGVYYTALTLEEYTASGWVIRDSVTYNSTTTFGGGNNGGDPCALKNISTLGNTVPGVLTNTSCLISGYRFDIYRFTAVAGSQIAILMQSSAFYTFQILYGPNGGDPVAAVEEGWTDGQTLIYLTAPTTGEYHLVVTSNDPATGGPGALGPYNLTVAVI